MLCYPLQVSCSFSISSEFTITFLISCSLIVLLLAFIRLSAWTIRTIHQANFPEWENLLYVDPQMVSKTIEWLLQWQDIKAGAFHETPYYSDTPLNRKAAPYSYGLEWQGPKNITLTAHCLITLEQTINTLQGSVHSQASLARNQAIRSVHRRKLIYVWMLNVCDQSYVNI